MRLTFINQVRFRMFGKLVFVSLLIASFSCGQRNRDRAESTSLTGKVVRVLDGDTYEILLDGNHTERIRMEGIDAPERGMPYYKVSKNYLGSLCFKRNVTLEVQSKDRYGRTIAFGYLDDGRELSAEMLKAGLAWHYKKYNSDKNLAELEKRARDSKVGLWKDSNPMAPWDNRRYHRNGISTKDSFDINDGNR